MFIPLRNFGAYGTVHDTMGESLPVGVWTDALNVRFTGIELQKMLEPVVEAEFSAVSVGYSCGSLHAAYTDLADSVADGYAWLLEGGDSNAKDSPIAEVNGYAGLAVTSELPVVGAVGPVAAFMDACPGVTAWRQTANFFSENCELSISGRTDLGVAGVDIVQAGVIPTGHTDGGVAEIKFHATRISSGAAWAPVSSVDFWGDTPAGSNSSVTKIHLTVDYSTYEVFNLPIAMVAGDTYMVHVRLGGSRKTWVRVISSNGMDFTQETSAPIAAIPDTGGVAADHKCDVVGSTPREVHGAVMSVGQEISTQQVDALWVAMQRNYSSYDPPLAEGDAVWFQPWSDGLSSYMAVATQTKLYMWQASGETGGAFLDATNASGSYNETGRWQSFEWGDTVIFNNGKDAPQIYDPGLGQFKDLPNWGMISSAADITFGDAPSIDTHARCDVLLPYKNFLVALATSEGRYSPNTTWWSDATALSTYKEGLGDLKGPPSWDYESPSTLSGKQEVGVGEGALTWGAVLNENLIIYSSASATAMQAVGGTQVMSFRRLFNKGCASLHLAAEFNNRHFVVSRDQIYVHDGSTVKLIAKDRVEDEFFRRAGKGGRLT